MASACDSFFPTFARRCITFAAPDTAAPVHKKNNRTKLLCLTSKVRCLYFSQLSFRDFCKDISVFANELKIITSKKHRVKR